MLQQIKIYLNKDRNCVTISCTIRIDNQIQNLNSIGTTYKVLSMIPESEDTLRGIKNFCSAYSDTKNGSKSTDCTSSILLLLLS